MSADPPMPPSFTMSCQATDSTEPWPYAVTVAMALSAWPEGLLDVLLLDALYDF